ncbi:MAG: hypothetical protein V9G12_23200 [Microthrixaceae bacterium]
MLSTTFVLMKMSCSASARRFSSAPMYPGNSMSSKTPTGGPRPGSPEQALVGARHRHSDVGNLGGDGARTRTAISGS